ncbi:NAD(P)-binding protein [Pontibacter qinzhouensis]|uniref:NAD(P)-binding protein n=1 Tax=Pontibacter qinzhouensis TaxID=2603253 RepID=A0A5C8K848_9BACT|nr:NAD(P)-binding protein [Pontibacter qinzhouensis]TXK49266.1 NAD(P)-binding protein [Pontibacter qinzhouensis]
MKKNISIIGAGISGLSAARFLAKTADVVVLEQAEKIGGLVKCDLVSGNLFHKVGGHVFNAKNKAVSEWFWAQFDQEKEFIKAKRNAKILINQKLIGYPIENYLGEFDKETVQNVLADLLKIQNTAPKAPFAYNHFEAFLEGTFGETLYKLYFKPYNQKIWNTDLSLVALEWLEGKLPMPNIQDILLSNIVKEEESDMVHASFYYPKTGGSQFIANRLAQGINIITDQWVSSISLQNGQLLLNASGTADAVIYTGDVRKLSQLIQIEDAALQHALQAVEELKSNGTSNLFCECDDNDLSWLYIPEDFTRAHRIIYTGNFSPANNAGSTRKTCVVEFSGKVPLQEMEEEINKLPGNLRPLQANYEPNSYVVQEKDTRQKITNLKQQLQKHHIYLTGRFAEWEYYNMDKAIEASMILSKNILTP